jgi:hypothetical protein
MNSSLPIALILAHQLTIAEANSALPNAPVIEPVQTERFRIARGRRLRLRPQRA